MLPAHSRRLGKGSPRLGREGACPAVSGGSVYLHDAVAHGQSKRLQPRSRLELGEDARHVGANCSGADVEAFRDLFVAQAVGQSLEHLQFPVDEPLERQPHLAVPPAFLVHEPERLEDLLEREELLA